MAAQPAPQSSTELFDDALNLSPKQRTVLSALQKYPVGAKASELATQLSMHINTVRGHLDELIDRGAVQALTSAASGRGRPSLIFQVRVPDSRAIANEYISLIEVLSDALEGQEEDLALKIGRTWAQKMRANTDYTPVTVDGALGRLHSVLRDIGFDPALPTPAERKESPDEAVLPLHSCPFIGSDGEAPSRFICDIHAGFLRETVDDRLQLQLTPLAAVGECHVHLSPEPEQPEN